MASKSSKSSTRRLPPHIKKARELLKKASALIVVDLAERSAAGDNFYLSAQTRALNSIKSAVEDIHQIGSGCVTG